MPTTMTETRMTEPTRDNADYRQRIGQRLRSIRHQQGLSLAEVEERSGGRWKAVVVGAYERGDRAVNIARMQELAEFYGVPVVELLPPSPRSHKGDSQETASRVVIDLTSLEANATSDDPVIRALRGFAARIRMIRGDHNGRVLTLRGNDIPMLASTVDRDPVEVMAFLRQRHIMRAAA